MEIENFLRKPLIFRKDDSLSYAIAKMVEEKRCEALIFDKEFEGIVSAKNLLKSPISNPEKMKIGDFATKINLKSPEAPLQDFIKYMLANEYKEIPIEYRNEIMTISKIKLLEMVSIEILHERRVKDIMLFPHSVNINEDLAEVKTILKNLNVTQLPVVDNDNRIEGSIHVLDILNTFITKERAKPGQIVGEKIAQEKIPISSFINRDVIKVSENEKISRIADLMLKKNENTVFVEKDGKLVGMLTVKNILKLVENPLEDVYVHMSGFDCIEDDMDREMIKKEVEIFIKKMKKFTIINYFAIHMDKRNKGGRSNYSVSGRMSTHHHTFVADGEEWNAVSVVKLFLDKLEKEIKRKVERERIR